MLSADIDQAALDKAIAAFKTLDNSIIEPEFQKAGDKTVKSLTGNLKGGVASRSGDLRQAISGEVRQVVGAEVEMRMSNSVEHDGYNYAGRLDKDGSLRWRAGRFKGYRTFGWFTYFLNTKGKGVMRRYFRRAVENVVTQLAKEIES